MDELSIEGTVSWRIISRPSNNTGTCGSYGHNRIIDMLLDWIGGLVLLYSEIRRQHVRL